MNLSLPWCWKVRINYLHYLLLSAGTLARIWNNDISEWKFGAGRLWPAWCTMEAVSHVNDKRQIRTKLKWISPLARTSVRVCVCECECLHRNDLGDKHEANNWVNTNTAMNWTHELNHIITDGFGGKSREGARENERENVSESYVLHTGERVSKRHTWDVNTERWRCHTLCIPQNSPPQCINAWTLALVNLLVHKI